LDAIDAAHKASSPLSGIAGIRFSRVESRSLEGIAQVGNGGIVGVWTADDPIHVSASDDDDGAGIGSIFDVRRIVFRLHWLLPNCSYIGTLFFETMHFLP